MLLSPVKFFVIQALLILIIAIAIFTIAKSFRKNPSKSYFLFFIKTLALAVLGAAFLFIVSTAFNPRFTLSLMRDYWRLEMIEDQIDYQQQHQYKFIPPGEHQTKNR